MTIRIGHFLVGGFDFLGSFVVAAVVIIFFLKIDLLIYVYVPA